MRVEASTAIRAAAMCGSLMLSATPAAADWRFTGFVGVTFHGDTTIVDSEDAAPLSHWNLGGAGTFLRGGPIGVEGLAVYTFGFFNRKEFNETAKDIVIDSHSFALMGNVVLAAPRRGAEYGLRPFVSGGLGLLQVSRRDTADAFSVPTNLLGFNIGGGAVGSISDRTGVRFDLRYFRSLRGTSEAPISFGPVELSYWTGFVGIVFRPWQK